MRAPAFRLAFSQRQGALRPLGLACAVLLLTVEPSGADLREAVGRVLPATVAVEWRSTEEHASAPQADKAVDGAVKLLVDSQKSDDRARALQSLLQGAQPQNVKAPPDAVGLASGTVVSADGLVVTLLAPTGEGAYSVTFADGRTLSANLLVDDRRSGLQLLKVDGEDMPHVALADGEAALGQQVVAVYVAYGKRRVAAQGIIAAIGESPPTLPTAVLQSDLRVGSMSAGAPLVDIHGKLLAIVAAREADDRAQEFPTYAIPADYVGLLIEARELEETVVERGRLGIAIEGPTEPGTGPRVTGVAPDTPAAAAGVQEGDEIVSIDGQTVSAVTEVLRLIGRHRPGDRVSVVMRRGDEQKKLDVTLGRFEQPPKTADASRKPIEAVQPQTLHVLNPDGTLKSFPLRSPDGKAIQLSPDYLKLLQGQPPATDPYYPHVTPPYGVVPATPAPTTIRVQRTDVEKRLSQLDRNVQSIGEQLDQLTEEVKKLREVLADP